MTVLMQMWVGRQRPRRQEFQMLSVPIGQKLAYVYYECEPGRRSAARSHRDDETVRRYFGRPGRREAAGGSSASLFTDISLPVPAQSDRADPRAIRFQSTSNATVKAAFEAETG